jgi:hypothetical protein
MHHSGQSIQRHLHQFKFRVHQGVIKVLLMMALSYQGHYDASLTAERSEQHQPDKETQPAAKYCLPLVMNLPHSYHCTKELSGHFQRQP